MNTSNAGNLQEILLKVFSIGTQRVTDLSPGPVGTDKCNCATSKDDALFQIN